MNLNDLIGMEIEYRYSIVSPLFISAIYSGKVTTVDLTDIDGDIVHRNIPINYIRFFTSEVHDFTVSYTDYMNLTYGE